MYPPPKKKQTVHVFAFNNLVNDKEDLQAETRVRMDFF